MFTHRIYLKMGPKNRALQPKEGVPFECLITNQLLPVAVAVRRGCVVLLLITLTGTPPGLKAAMG